MNQQHWQAKLHCTLERETALLALGISPVAGVDEAGRGPLAGPLIAAAAILPSDFSHPLLTDSKRLAEKQREAIFEELVQRQDVFIGIGEASSIEIDEINILRATHQAMREAVMNLPMRPAHALIDGLPVNPFPFPQTAVIKGDALCLSIAAASVIAKVTRDRHMQKAETLYPRYGFAKHKGYGTKQHLQALQNLGPCAIHRKTFKPVAESALWRRAAQNVKVEKEVDCLLKAL